MQNCTWFPDPIILMLRGAWEIELTRRIDASSVPRNPGPALRCSPTTIWLAHANASLKNSLLLFSPIKRMQFNQFSRSGNRLGLKMMIPSPACVDVGLSRIDLNCCISNCGIPYVSNTAPTNSNTFSKAIWIDTCVTITPTDSTVRLLNPESSFQDIGWCWCFGKQLSAILFKLLNCIKAPGFVNNLDAISNWATSLFRMVFKQ